MGTDLNKLGMDQVMPFLKTQGAGFALSLISAIAILVIGLWLAKWIRQGVRKTLAKRNVDALLVQFGSNVIYAALVAFVLIAAIGKLGIQTSSFIAVVGAAGLAVGLALQGALANFAAGVMIIIFRPYRLGDYITASGVSGTVTDLHIFNTELTTPDNCKIIVPNSHVTGGAITNISAYDTRRVDLKVSVAYSDDIATVRDTIEKVIAADDRILSDPAPNVRMNSMDDSGIGWIIRPWVKSGDYWNVYWDLTEKLKAAFDEAGISIPFPQQDVHLYSSEDKSQA